MLLVPASLYVRNAHAVASCADASTEHARHLHRNCGHVLKVHHFRGKQRLGVLHRGLLTVTRDFGWQLEAWAVFSNHYHFVGHSPPDAPDASNLPDMLSVLHVKTSGWINKLDGTPGR